MRPRSGDREAWPCRLSTSEHARREHAHEELLDALRAARLDATYDEAMRRLPRVELLILDDLALQPLEATETSDFYELLVERHRAGSTITTSNRDPAEIVTMVADPLLAGSAIDRLRSAAYELVVEGSSYRQRQKPTLTTSSTAPACHAGAEDGT